MKKAEKSKKKAASKAKDSKNELPELVGVMLKIAERLEALEKKMETVIVQTSTRSSGVKDPSGFFQNAVLPSQSNSSNQNQAPISRERPLYEAVCADCKKDCKVPFKPSGERPVYCKECFKKRRVNGSSKPQNAGVSVPQPRQVRVTPNGAGKVTVSEVVPASKKKHGKPAKKKKK